MEVFEAGYPKIANVKYIFREFCYGIAEVNGKIMLVFSEKDDDYSLPGGGIEEGEDLILGLKREFLEETGYTIIKEDHLIDVHSTGKNSKGFDVERISHIFKVKIDEKTKVKPIEDWHKPDFYTIDEAKEFVDSHWQKKLFDKIF